MTLNELRWRKFPVLNDGFVCLVDVMGDDAAICQAARTSYGNDRRGDNAPDPQQQEKDRHLIRYLMRHHHTSVFEMAEVKLLVRTPIDCFRQWIRHRMANVNERSTRYTEAINSMATTESDEWRLQSTNNKQGSDGFLPAGNGYLDASNNACGLMHTNMERAFQDDARKLYETRLKAGIAREQARKDLPLSTYTEAYWKCDLHNIFHFLGLRMASEAQAEIRQYAKVIGEEIIRPLFPLAWEAFEDYRLGAVTLSQAEQTAIWRLSGEKAFISTRGYILSLLQKGISGLPADWKKDRCRERDEFLDKLERMGLIES